MTALLAVAAFLAAAAGDYADSRNTLAVSQGRPHAAAAWSIVMYGLGLLGFYGVPEVSAWLAVPTVAGLYVGSWLAVRRPRRMEAPDASRGSL